MASKNPTQTKKRTISRVVKDMREFLTADLEEKTLPNAGVAIYDGLSDSGLTKEALFLSFYSVVATILCFNRVKVKSANLRVSEQYKYPNIYAIIFSSSGTGKDNSINDVIRLYADPTLKRMKDDFERERMEAINELTLKAESYGITNKLKIQQYIDNKKPRDFHHFVQPKTSASLIQAVGGYTQLPIGGANIRIPEVADKILNMNRGNDDKEIFSIIKELFERGNLDARILKSEKDTPEIEDIPVNFLAYSDPKRLLGSDYGRNMLETLLDGGYARRTCISLNTEQKKIEIDADYVSTLQKNVGEQRRVEGTVDLISSAIGKMYSYTKVQNVYTVETEAELLLEEYKTYCKIISMQELENGHPIFADEVKDRWIRALRLSVSVHAIEHPDSTVIDALSMEFAILLVNRLAVSFQHQLKNEDVAFKQMLDYALNKGDWVSKSEARQTKIYSWNAFSHKIAEFLEIVASNGNYKLEIKRIKPMGMKFKITDRRDE